MENNSETNEVVSYNHSSEFLRESVFNAELLLHYATEQGLDVKIETISSIIKAKSCQQTKKWDTQSEIDFWMQFKSLSSLVKPVSVDSLFSTKRILIKEPNFIQRLLGQQKSLSYSRKSARMYMLWAMVVVIAMLTTQIFSLKGSTLLSKIQNNNKRISEIDYRVGELRLLLNSDPNNESAALERRRLESEKMQLDQEIKSSIDLLTPWVRTLRKFAVLGSRGVLKKDETATTANAVSISTMNAGPGFGPPDMSTNIAEIDMNDRINTIQESQNFTLILQLYILPLFYGLIGGFVFVLRTLSADIKTMTFSQNSKIKYSLRIILGTLAGLIVGLLWGDIESQQITFLESLSTSAIAFIAGYAVEYVFNGLDRLADSIGKKKVEEAK